MEKFYNKTGIIGLARTAASMREWYQHKTLIEEAGEVRDENLNIAQLSVKPQEAKVDKIIVVCTISCFHSSHLSKCFITFLS